MYEASVNRLKGGLMTSTLAAVPGKQLAMLSVTHHSDALAPKQRHLLQPANLIQPQPSQDGSKVGRNMAMLVCSDGATGPIHQHQIIGKGIRQTIRFALAGKRQQQGWQSWCCWLFTIETLLDTGVAALFRPVGQWLITSCRSPFFYPQELRLSFTLPDRHRSS